MPRDWKGGFESAWLPDRKGQDAELDAFLAEVFLAGCSTRDLARITEKHLGRKYDSKQISRIVARASTDWKPGGCGDWKEGSTDFSMSTGQTLRFGSTGGKPAELLRGFRG